MQNSYAQHPSNKQTASHMPPKSVSAKHAGSVKTVLQTKLKIGQSDDKYEREADRVADQVMRMPTPQFTFSTDSIIAEKAVSNNKRTIQRLCSTCEDNEELVQEKTKGGNTSEVTPEISSELASLNGNGQPLSMSERNFYEPRFNEDFSNVRVHRDEKAAAIARSINAHAFTLGNNIAFGAGEPSQESSSGRRLLAHELTHVVQQKGGRNSNYKTPVSDPVIQRLGNPVTESDLASPTVSGISASEQTLRRFMREVYRRQVILWTTTGATYLHEVPPSELVTLPGSYAIPGRTIEVHKDIQHPVTNMINDARAALPSARAAGGVAANIRNVGIRSGYRSAASQFNIWTTWAPVYYARTRADRQDSTRFPGGEHSNAAAQYLAEYTNQRVFSPGFSPHQHGRTVDLSYQEGSAWAPADTSAAWISRWTSSWFFAWLQQNASRYGFFQNPNLNEPWHWEFSPLFALILSIIQWLMDLLEPLIGRRQLWLGGERSEGELQQPSSTEDRDTSD